MRVTVDNWVFHFAECPKVFLDGKEMKLAIWADDEAGIVRVYDEDADSQPIVIDGQFAVKELHGDVEIRGIRLLG